MTYYYVEKIGVYAHGVFWIGTDVEEGRRMLYELADRDCDSHHDWVLKEFSNPDSIQCRNDKEDSTILCINKGESYG